MTLIEVFMNNTAIIHYLSELEKLKHYGGTANDSVIRSALEWALERSTCLDR